MWTAVTKSVLMFNTSNKPCHPFHQLEHEERRLHHFLNWLKYLKQVRALKNKKRWETVEASCQVTKFQSMVRLINIDSNCMHLWDSHWKFCAWVCSSCHPGYRWPTKNINHFRFLGNCPPIPPPSQHPSLSEKC